MSMWLAGGFAAVWLATATLGSEEPALPTWNEGEHAAGLAAGALFPDESPPGSEPRLDLAPPTTEEVAASANPAPPVPAKFWTAYFAERPRTFLIDPQGLLNASDTRDRLGFLNYHAGDSAIDLFVYVFQGDQEIPGELRDEELAERLFSTGRPAAIVFYYQGAPRRATLSLSPALTNAVSAGELRRALESSVMQALEKNHSSAQLEAFLVQMSIRIYWMERLWGGGTASAEGKPTSEPVKPAKKPDKKAMLLAKLQPWLDQARLLALPAAALAGALLVVGAIWAGLRLRARYRFPVLTVEPRLGGDHAAGAGAVISFASATTSLAAQRQQRPDDARRA